jgi:hypothetical protein
MLDAPGRDWHHPWLRLNLLLREMKHEVFRTRDPDACPVVKAPLNKAIWMRAKLRRGPWWN